MRTSLKIREAKNVIDKVLESNHPMHFGNADEYKDHALNLIIFSVHGVSEDQNNHLRIFYEYKERFGKKIKDYYICTV